MLQIAQERATRALWELVNLNPTAHEAIAKAGNPEALVTLLKTGIPDAKDYALWSLSLSISEDSQMVVFECGGVQPLIEQLSDGRTLTQQQAAAALAKLARDNDETRAAITKLGGVKPLISLLSIEQPEPGSQQRPEAAVEAAAVEAAAPPQSAGAVATGAAAGEGATAEAASAPAEEAAAAAAAAGGGKAPQREPSAASSSSQGGPGAHSASGLALSAETAAMMSDLVHQNAADALANLAGDPAARDEIVVAGGIPPLVQLLEVVGRNTKQFAATALARLSKDHEATQLAIAKAGAIASLVALLAGNEGGEAQEAAAGAILSLADHEGNRQTITDSGGIGYLVMLLGSTNSKARESKRRKAWSSLDHLSPPLSTSHLP